MLTPTEKIILQTLEERMTRKQWADKCNYKIDSLNPIIRKLVRIGCIEEVGFSGKEKLYEATGRVPTESKTLGFTVFGVRI